MSDLSNLYCKYTRPNPTSAGVPDECSSLEYFIHKEYGIKKTTDKFVYVPELSNDFRFDGHDSKKLPSTINKVEKLFSTWVPAQ